MDDIEDLLHRRTDLSTFLVHLTRDTRKHDARDNLMSLLEDRTIQARTALGMAASLDEHLKDTAKTQRVVCFSETPLEHSWMMVRDIRGRRQEFKPYGIVFSKSFSRRQGCNPVWYLDITTGHPWLTGPVNDLVAKAKAASKGRLGRLRGELLAMQEIFRLTPFIEQMGNPSGTRKEFWWEREWRHVGDFEFRPRKVVAVLAPETDHEDLADEIAAIDVAWEARRVPLLDPTWGLERMISALARIDPDDAGPWPE
ncbi:hypothetical protein GCM10010531_44750 [Blastococcus jejuensis]|uniref:Abortive phage resistance protein AbiGi, antitoxin n=1 Tax=Blastococcus jejuensis TaxID=351224 RepID=A0ABP6PPT3_9ACTN